jgi:hypothetical protein
MLSALCVSFMQRVAGICILWYEVGKNRFCVVLLYIMWQMFIWLDVLYNLCIWCICKWYLLQNIIVLRWCLCQMLY